MTGPHISIPTPSFYDLSLYSASQTLKLPPLNGALKLPPVTEATRVPLVIESYKINAANAGSTIHAIELEAYAAVLKAFKAQSDLLSWGKEGLITELRRELNVTDQEHRKILTQISSDKSIKMIRESQQGIFHTREMSPSVTYAPGFGLNSVSCAPFPHNLKLACADVSAMQRYVAHSQPTPVPTPPLLLQNWDSFGNGELSNYCTSYAEKPMRVVVPSVTNLSESKYRGPVKPHPKTLARVAEVRNVKKKSGTIRICATETVLSKVQNMVYGRENPLPDQVKEAKLILMEQERAILEALAKLADVIDEDDSPKGYHDQLESQKEFSMMSGRISQDYLLTG